MTLVYKQYDHRREVATYYVRPGNNGRQVKGEAYGPSDHVKTMGNPHDRTSPSACRCVFTAILAAMDERANDMMLRAAR